MGFPYSLIGPIIAYPLGHLTSPANPLAHAHLFACLMDQSPQSKLKNLQDVRMWSPSLSEKAWQEFQQQKSPSWSKTASERGSVWIRSFGRRSRKSNTSCRMQAYTLPASCSPYRSLPGPQANLAIEGWSTKSQLMAVAQRERKELESTKGNGASLWCCLYHTCPYVMQLLSPPFNAASAPAKKQVWRNIKPRLATAPNYEEE